MAERVSFSGRHQSLADVALFRRDTAAALRGLATPGQPTPDLLVGLSRAELGERLDELDRLATLALLAAVEARFRIDYLRRCYERKPRDDLTRRFRSLYAAKATLASFEEDILEAWKAHDEGLRRALGDLKSMLRYRHWLAHGRYWTPKLGRSDGRYDFETVFDLAQALLDATGL